MFRMFICVRVKTGKNILQIKLLGLVHMLLVLWKETWDDKNVRN